MQVYPIYDRNEAMVVRCRRHFVSGGTVFVTVVADRRARLLTHHANALRAAFRRAPAERPFDVEAVVVLSDHPHALMRLEGGDAAWLGCWRSITSALRARYAGRA